MGFLQGNMGCGPSKGGDKWLHLPGIGTKFSPAQVSRLNAYFNDLIDVGAGLRDPEEEGVTVLIEELIQRLICGVGILDPRFSSMFLISLEPLKFKGKPDKSLSYLVRLDELSQPNIYPEEADSSCILEESGPHGFARVRPTGPSAIQWAEFINGQGYLRRDKVQERFVELLAQSAARSNLVTKPSDIDESKLCGSPGKIVDADTLYNLLHSQPNQRVFFGPGDLQNQKFPDPRKFRIAIVEGCSCIRLRVGMMYSNDSIETDIEVTLVLGIGFTSWPTSAHFPGRTNLCHIDCLLFHQAASTGFYIVPAGPHPTVRCEDRSTLWQLRFPAAEQTLLKHYREDSVPGKTLRALRCTLMELRASSGAAFVISDYMLKTLLWWRLEEESISVPATMRMWTHDSLATHVLTLLDRLVIALRTQRLNSYFLSWFNVMLNCPGGGSLHYTEEDYAHDADVVTCYVRRLCDGMLLDHGSEIDPWSKTEAALVTKWSDVLSDLTPPLATRSRRLSFTPVNSSGYSSIAASQYSLRQLDYIGQVLRSLLNVRTFTLTKGVNGMPVWNQPISKESPGECEDLIYLLSAILDQAKQMTLEPTKINHFSLRPKKKQKNKLQNEYYDHSVGLFLEEIRNAKHTVDLSDDNAVVREVLKWLYLALDKDRKVIGAVLRPYLSKLFSVSHENCWHVVEWKKRQNKDETEALSKFCSLIVDNKVTVNEAIIDAFNKGWIWADTTLKTCKQLPGGVELIFAPSPGKVIRHKVNPNIEIFMPQSTRSLGRTLPRQDSRNSLPLVLPLRPLKEGLQLRLESSPKGGNFLPLSHNVLRDSSPLTQCSETGHRYGTHRGLGTIIHALLNLKKFTILQEVSALLPETERAQILDDIQRISRELRRPRRAYHTVSSRRDVVGTYRGREAGPPTQPPSLTGTLIDTCRAARRRQPSATAVTDPAFFEPPNGPGPWARSDSCQEMVHLRRSTKRMSSKRSDVVTKL